MTISHQKPQNPFDADAHKPFPIPARPSSSAQQPLPTWKASEAENEAEAQIVPTEPMAPAAPVSQYDQAPSFASPLSPMPPVPPRPSKRRIGTLYITLAVLAMLVALGGIFGQQLLTANTGGSQSLNFPSGGSYAQVPLSAQQINAIQHLSAHMKYKASASLYVSHMSLDDKIGQLIMVEYNPPANPDPNVNICNYPSYTSDLDYMLHTLHVGGVIMYECNMKTLQQTKSDIAQMQQRANIPLIISTDEEGGPYVRRVTRIYGYRMSPTEIEQSGNVNVATQQGLKVSQQLAALGINENLAPDVDVNQVNGFDMITRTFGETPAQVVKYAGAYMQAMQNNGTIACIKHFPGLGGATPDAHATLPVVKSSAQDIYNTDLAPFKSLIQSPAALLNPGMIMPTDVLMPAIDPTYPAELSHIFMTDILRNQFHYDGVALTDALYMQGITNTWDMDTASVMALQAGNDMLLGATGTDQTIGVINAIKQALRDGRLTTARIDESVTRIIALKMQYHLMPTYVPGV